MYTRIMYKFEFFFAYNLKYLQNNILTKTIFFLSTQNFKCLVFLSDNYYLSLYTITKKNILLFLWNIYSQFFIIGPIF